MKLFRRTLLATLAALTAAAALPLAAQAQDISHASSASATAWWKTQTRAAQ